MLREGAQLGWNPAVQESQTCCEEVAAGISGPWKSDGGVGWGRPRTQGPPGARGWEAKAIPPPSLPLSQYQESAFYCPCLLASMAPEDREAR